MAERYDPSGETLPELFDEEPTVEKAPPAPRKSRRGTAKVAKTYKLPAELAETLRRKVALLSSEGIILEQSECVAWGIEKALEDLAKGRSSTLLRRARR